MSEPTGEQVTLTHGDQTAVVVQVGGGVRSYEVSGRAVLDGYPAGARPDGGRGQVLVPWPNRVRDGRYRWQGADQQLPLTEVEHHNAIHGLVRWAEWRVVERTGSTAQMAVRVWPQPGYPFLLDVEAHYALSDEGLTVTLVGRNSGDEALPYAAGQHPYLAVGDGVVDDASLTVPAGEWVRSDERGLPVGTEGIDGSPYDFRTARHIGTTVVDTPYAGLHRDADGRARVRLDLPDGHGAELWAGEGAHYFQVFTGDTLAPERRRRGLAVEPMSALPDAFNSGTGLRVLQPGEEHALTWGLRAW